MTYKYQGWKNVQTQQSREILTELIETKADARASMIISNTGDGKTTAIRLFKQKEPNHTYIFTLGDSYSLRSLLDEMHKALGIVGDYKYRHNDYRRHAMQRIAQRILEIAAEGESPILIFDEAEHARIPVLKAFKELYDHIIMHCGIVLIGTHQLIQQLEKKSLGQSIPQLKRRFKAGTRFVTTFNKSKDMRPFFDLYVKDLDLRDTLVNICDNYGELHDYLDPFLRHCDKKGIEPTDAAFRLYHKIPKTK